MGQFNMCVETTHYFEGIYMQTMVFLYLGGLIDASTDIFQKYNDGSRSH